MRLYRRLVGAVTVRFGTAVRCSSSSGGLRRLALNALVVVAIYSVTVRTMAPQDDAKSPSKTVFDVVSIRANSSGGGVTHVGLQPGGRFVMVNGTVMTLLLNAYERLSYEIVNAPAWTRTNHYDVTAVAGHDTTPEELRAMIQSMLADRFRLASHTEEQEVPAYALTRVNRTGPTGASLQPWTVDCTAYRSGESAAPPPAPPGRRRAIPTPVCNMSAGPNFFLAGGYPLSALASSLSSNLERRVIDETGLRGEFEIRLLWAPEDATASDLPSLFTAVTEQLGLKLESRKMRAPVLVIDTVERPSEN